MDTIMSTALKKLKEIHIKKRALQQEEEKILSQFMQEFSNIISSMPILNVDLDVLIGSMAITIESANHDNPNAKNDPQIKLWKERGTRELNQFRRHKKNQRQEENLTNKNTTSSAKSHPAMEKVSPKN